MDTETEDARQLIVRLPAEMHAQIKAYAAAEDLAMAQVVRRAIRAFLDKEA